MTYESREESVYEGSPVELYEFNREGAQFWRYTSADSVREFQGATYRAIAISRSSIEQSQDIFKNNLKVTMSSNTAFVQQYITSPPTDRIVLLLRRFHHEDPEVISLWSGRVVNVEFREETVEVTLEPVHASLKRPALRRLYQATCPHLLYGPVCKADPTTFRLTTNLTAVSGLTLTSPDIGLQADDYYTGGYVELQVAGVFNKRFILSHTGNDIEINLQLSGAAVGVEVFIYPGCSHNVTICRTKFNNLANYGGQPWIPRKHPMAGVPIF